MKTHATQSRTGSAGRLARVVAAAALSVAAFSAFSSTAAAQVAQSNPDVIVTENVGSQDTGIDVVASQRVTIRATTDKIWSGCWGWANNGPEGTGKCGWGTLPLPYAPAYSLLASVNGQLRYVGTGASFPAPASGRLILKINDDTPGNGHSFFRASAATTTEMARTPPDVTGHYERRARMILSEAGWGSSTSYTRSDCASELTVVSQNPSPTEMTFATNVGLIVGAGPDGNRYTMC